MSGGLIRKLESRGHNSAYLRYWLSAWRGDVLRAESRGTVILRDLKAWGHMTWTQNGEQDLPAVLLGSQHSFSKIQAKTLAWTRGYQQQWRWEPQEALSAVALVSRTRAGQ